MDPGEFVANPLRAIDSLFAEAVAACDGDPQAVNAAGDWGVNEYVQAFMDTPGALELVPDLYATPLHLLTDGSLVRVRCMVQQTYNPEMYAGVCARRSRTATHHDDDGSQSEVSLNDSLEGLGECPLATTKYRDYVAGDDLCYSPTDPSTVLCDRWVLYCVPIPAESPWSRDADAQQWASVSSDAASSADPGGNGAGLNRKRRRDGDDDDDGSDNGDAGTEAESAALLGLTGSDPNAFSTSESPTKRARDDELVDMVRREASSYAPSQLNLPVPEDDRGVPCVAKLYTRDIEPKVNEVVEMIGVIQVDPVLTPFDSADLRDSVDFADDFLAHNPPSSLVPRIHALNCRILEHTSPVIPPALSDLGDAREVIAPHVPELRAQLLALVCDCVGGDALAAEYVVMHLLSRIYTRAIMSLGAFPLNLTGAPEGSTFGQSLASLLQLVADKAVYMPLSLDFLNHSKFAPAESVNQNRLVAGRLQLVDGTHVVVDETALEEGQVQEAGLKNLRTLMDVVASHELIGEYQYFRLELKVDIPVVVVSVAKSLVTTDNMIVVPLEPAADGPNAAGVSPDDLDEGALLRLRQYLAVMRWNDHQLGDTEEQIQNEFVQRRQAGQSVSQQTFERWLLVARMLSLSHGETVLTAERWAEALALEDARAARMAAGGGDATPGPSAEVIRLA